MPSPALRTPSPIRWERDGVRVQAPSPVGWERAGVRARPQAGSARLQIPPDAIRAGASERAHTARRMETANARVPFDAGLAAFDVDELCHPGRLTEAVITKLNLMPPGRLAHERLEQAIRLMLEMIREAVCGRYRRLPLTTLADFLTALHYFMKWRDRRPDTWDGGYMDDLELALETLGTHEAVVTAYRDWKARQGER